MEVLKNHFAFSDGLSELSQLAELKSVPLVFGPRIERGAGAVRITLPIIEVKHPVEDADLYRRQLSKDVNKRAKKRRTAFC